MDTLSPPLFILLAGIVAGAVVTWLTWRRRSAAGTAAPAEGDTIEMAVEERDGEPVAERIDEDEPPPWYRRRGFVLAVGLVALVVLAGSVAVNELATARAPARFVVVVAPFADGGDGQTGRNVAAELARTIEVYSRGAINAELAARSPTTDAEALALAAAERSDVLIWGEVEPGAMLDSASLLARLVYTPNGPYAPLAWQGYSGRFAMPQSFVLAGEPVNGRVVLPPLLMALYDYGRGQPDLAFFTLGQLLQNYPALSAPLPRTIRGNILWARGINAAAADEYRQALAGSASDQALLANNLGAILQDAGDPQALSAFAEAVRLLNGRDLAELRANLGVLALREGRARDAVVELEQARNLTAPSLPLLLDLAWAYRDTGRLDEAAAALEAAVVQQRREAGLVPAVYSAMYRQRSEGALAEQQALLQLARQLQAEGPVVWELEAADPLAARVLTPLRDQLSGAAETSEQAMGQWRRRSASESAAFPGTGLVAAGQADRLRRQAERQRYLEALVGSELERGGAPPVRDVLGAIFRGGTSSPSLSILDGLIALDPSNPELHLARGRAQRFNEQFDAAQGSYNRAIELAPQRPDGYFGRGMVAHDRGDLAGAAEQLGLALDRNSAFFPARIELARLAEERGDWAAAVEQRRALLQSRPGPRSTVALAQDLRRSGQAGWQEAEQLLLPQAATYAGAAIELGRLYNDAGRPDAAISAYNDALRIDPNSSAAAFELGETLAAQGDYQGARRSLENALRFDEDNLDARLAMADLFQGPLNDSRRAEREYSTALRQGVNDPVRLAQIGVAARKNGNLDQASRAYEAAVELRPDDPQLRYELGRIYYERGRATAANEQQLRVIALTENPPTAELAALRASALIALGDLAREQGDLPLANSYYTQALQIDGNRVAAQLGLGLSAVGQNNWGVAHGYFETAAALPGGESSPEAQFWLAESLLRRGDYAGATAGYQAAIGLREAFPEAYLGLAQVQYAQGGRDDALATVDQGLRWRPNFAEGLLFKGKLLQEAGRFDEAMTAYNQSIGANGRIAETQFRRGVLHIQNGDYDRALGDLRRAAQLQPNFPEAAYWLGRAYFAQGRLEPALEAFRDAISYNANFADAIFYSGLVSEELGQTAEAISAYRTVIQIDAGSELAARARTQLDRLT